MNDPACSRPVNTPSVTSCGPRTRVYAADCSHRSAGPTSVPGLGCVRGVAAALSSTSPSSSECVSAHAATKTGQAYRSASMTAWPHCAASMASS